MDLFGSVVGDECRWGLAASCRLLLSLAVPRGDDYVEFGEEPA